MTDQIVTEWIMEWAQVKDTEREKVSLFAESILTNEDLFQAITHVLEESERFKSVGYHQIPVTYCSHNACIFLPALHRNHCNAVQVLSDFVTEEDPTLYNPIYPFANLRLLESDSYAEGTG
jgi:hypothetical protein